VAGGECEVEKFDPTPALFVSDRDLAVASTQPPSVLAPFSRFEFCSGLF
jgi:hypothetical protein